MESLLAVVLILGAVVLVGVGVKLNKPSVEAREDARDRADTEAWLAERDNG